MTEAAADLFEASGHRRVPLIAVCLAVLAALISVWLHWHGPVQFLDAGSYAAAIDALAGGDGVRTALAPSFSNFTALEFVERDGRIPFVDFPLGFPAAALVPALIFGARRAMIIVAVVSIAALVATIIIGPRPLGRASVGHRMPMTATIGRAMLAVGVVALPMFQAVTRAGLSEPLFCTLLVASLKLSIDGHRSEDSSRGIAAIVLAGLAGAVRFVGVPVVIIPAIVAWRTVGTRATAKWTALAVAPALLNVLWASSVGSGHVAGLREITRTDLRFFVHSIAGWVDHRHGTFDLLLAGDRRPPVAAIALAFAWCLGCAVALWALVRGRLNSCAPVVIAMAMAGVLTAGLFAGMLGFDSLVSPDNRLMLPAGVLTLVGIGWWMTERVEPPVMLGVVGLWLVLAAAPWTLSRTQTSAASSDLAAAVGQAELVLSDDADSVWWHTGASAAYLPLPTKQLSGEAIDQRGELATLICPLAANNGVIVVVGGAFADRNIATLLDELVAVGQLERSSFGSISRYRPVPQGC